ncbi:RNase A-like domain-containing protein [Taylorella equigenitalis]
MSKHVGKSKEYLLDRLKNDPRIKSHVSTFYNLNIAERAITDAMKKK